MIDIRCLLAAMTHILRSPDFPDAVALAVALDLDLSGSRTTKTKSAMGIHDARLKGGGIALGVVCGILPRREIMLLFEHSGIAYQAIKDEIFGADQRLIPSKLSQGFGVRFEIDGLTCGYTASSSEGEIESLSCEEPRAMPGG